TPGSEIDYDVTCTDTYLGDDCFPVNCYDDENDPEDPDPDPDPFDCVYYGTCEDEDDTAPEPDPCDKVKSQSSNSDYKNKVTDLKGKTNLQHESGYEEQKDGTYNTLSNNGDHSLHVDP